MNHFDGFGKMVDQWRKATPQEAANGFVAVCMVMEQIRTEKGGRVDYMRSYYYKPEMLERRAKRGDDVPSFWKPQDVSEAWLDYIDTGKASKEVAEILPTLGSYNAA